MSGKRKAPSLTSSSKGKSKVEREEEDNQEEEQDDNSDSSGSDSSDDDEEEDNDDDDDDDDDDDSDGNDEEEEEEEEEEEDEAPTKKSKTSSTTAAKKAPVKKAAATTKKAAKKKAATKKKVTKKSTKAKKESKLDEKKVIKSKVLRKSERLEEARKAYKWWEAPELANGVNWLKLEHPGINFAPPYVPHGVPLYYDGEPVELDSRQEELASFFAAMPPDGPQLGNPKTKKVFEQNFFDDFKEVLGSNHVIRKFEKCNFDKIREYLDVQKNLRKAATEEEKAAKKAEREKILLKFGYALIDGRVEKMGNFNMEPPGLFRGRGEHPKTGKLKVRCHAESVSINLAETACVPICTEPGHAWQSVQHDASVTWLSAWNENVQNQSKYVMLAASSSFKGKSDMEKYGKAIQLKSCIEKVRRDYTRKIHQTKDRADAQLGTAMWVIDVLALRVGGEKGEEEADTVGCCSLRVEHLSFNPDPESHEIELEFLGKDSMLYKQNINFAMHGDLGKTVYANLKSFCKRKEPTEDVFETLNPTILNKHLTSLMKGLTAKVFRTFNASITLEKELPSAESLQHLNVAQKMIEYNAANRQVAILCNHQKTVSKATETMFENLNEKLNTIKHQRDELIKWKTLAKSGKLNKIPLKADDKDRLEKIQADLQEATKKKEAAKTDAEKLNAAAQFEQAKAAQKLDQKRRFDEKHMYKTTPALTSIESRLEKWVEDLRKLEVDIRNRDENKEVALGTSKINYMDPRISVAWCKRCEVPIDKVFAKTLRDKFNWAMAVPPDWKFE